MQLLDSNKDFSQVEQSIVHRQRHLVLHLIQQFATWKVLQEQVKIVFVLHGLNEVDKETCLFFFNRGGRDVNEDLFLVFDVLNVL